MDKTFSILRHTICILAAVFISSTAYGQNIDTLFAKGNEAYKNGDYKTAAQNYQKILDGGYHSAELYHNLGNAYYRLGYIAPTILAYERAAVLDPTDSDIQHNLTLAHRLSTDNIVPLGQSLSSRIWENIVSWCSASTWGIITIVSIWIAIIFFVMFIYGKSVGVRRTSFYTFIVLLAFSAVFYALNRSADARVNEHSYAILTATNITVKSEPSDSGGDAFALHEGAKFSIEESLEEWYKIRLADGKTGWIPTWSAEKI